jgi:hypothetical protein
MKTYGKPFALGAYRANWVLTKLGSRVLRISGGMKQRGGKKGIEMSPYAAKALGEWLLNDWPALKDALTASDGEVEHGN